MRKMSKKQLAYLDARIANIELMRTEDPDRHIKAIIATTGLNFMDDLRLLVARCLDLKKYELAAEIML